MKLLLFKLGVSFVRFLIYNIITGCNDLIT